MMRIASWLIVISLGWASAPLAYGQDIVGSGSTFVFPVLSEWAAAYRQATGVAVGYTPIGSTSGALEITAERVDFGVSDVPLSTEQLRHDGLVQFPLVVGGIVPVVNLPGLAPGQLRFSGPLLADIFMGRVKVWNDPAIADLNPGLKLPRLAISIIHRSDGSGTTFNWADYLSRVSSAWQESVGAAALVAWPSGWGARGNGKVAEYVMQTKGAIGYVEFAYVLQQHLVYGLIRNRAGNFVEPGRSSFEAAIQDVDWNQDTDFNVVLNDSPNQDAFPVVAASFVLMRRTPKDPARDLQTFAFFKWALEHGQEKARALNYVPLETTLVNQITTHRQAKID